jgi:hypothetical protein
MSKYEVTDELRKMVKDKKETDPIIGPLLNKANKIEEILNIPPPATSPNTTPQQTYRYIPVDGDAFVSIKVMYGEIDVATKEYQKPTYTEETALAALKASVDANGIVGDNGTTYAPGSVTTTTPTPTPPLFNADSYPKLEEYIKGLKESDFSPPLHQKAAGMDASTTLYPHPYYPGQDIRQSAKFFSIGPDANMKPDTYTWLYNNCAFYGFLPYGHPTQNAVYYVGAEKLKQKIKQGLFEYCDAFYELNDRYPTIGEIHEQFYIPNILQLDESEEITEAVLSRTASFLYEAGVEVELPA